MPKLWRLTLPSYRVVKAQKIESALNAARLSIKRKSVMTKQESENIAKKLQTLQSPDEQIAYLSTVAERYPDERLLRLAFAQKIHEILLSENTSIQESDNPVAVGLENEYRLNATILAAKDAISHSDFKTAETLVDSVLPFAEEIALFYASSKTKRSAYYEDSFEEFVDFFLHRKEGAVQEILYPIGEVYALRGEIEFEMNAYKKAAADFQKAILYAPAHLAFYQEHLKSSLALKKSPEQIKKEIVAMNISPKNSCPSKKKGSRFSFFRAIMPFSCSDRLSAWRLSARWNAAALPGRRRCCTTLSPG